MCDIYKFVFVSNSNQELEEEIERVYYTENNATLDISVGNITKPTLTLTTTDMVSIPKIFR